MLYTCFREDKNVEGSRNNPDHFYVTGLELYFKNWQVADVAVLSVGADYPFTSFPVLVVGPF